MIAAADPTVVGAAIATGGLIVVALVNLAGGRSSRKRIEDAIDTGNGSSLGHTVYKLAGAVEVAIAGLHTNTKETLELRADMDAHQRQLDMHIEEDRVHALEIKNALEEQQRVVKVALEKEQTKVKDALDEAAS